MVSIFEYDRLQQYTQVCGSVLFERDGFIAPGKHLLEITVNLRDVPKISIEPVIETEEKYDNDSDSYYFEDKITRYELKYPELGYLHISTGGLDEIGGKYDIRNNNHISIIIEEYPVYIDNYINEDYLYSLIVKFTPIDIPTIKSTNS